MSIITSGGRHRARSGYEDMGTSPRIFEKDAELGKRDDEYRRHKRTKSQTASWTLLRWRRRRIIVTCLLFLVAYTIFQYLPPDLRPSISSIRPADSSADVAPTDDSHGNIGKDTTQQPYGAPPRKDDDPDNPFAKYYYNAIIKFYQLSASLQKARRTTPFYGPKKNVLFAASSLKSIAKLIPLACEMHKRDRNLVHVALFGRHSIPVQEIIKLNGVDEVTCDIYWHDARPDYAAYSTDFRAETGATFALKNINDFIRQQVLITDDLDEEDTFFKRSVTTEVKRAGYALIQIPDGSEERLQWLTQLEAESLKMWNIMSIDILIHAPPESVGSLRRLTRSLSEADYKGLGYPRLIIELPVEVDHMTKVFVDELKWPPKQDDPLKHTNLLVLRHRIPSKTITGEESSVRFAEAFYPTDPVGSHVLVLTPNAELSPLYYHYLKYHALEYRYSNIHETDRDELLGISLDVPPTMLDGTTRLNPPTTANLNGNGPYGPKPGAPGEPAPFLWAAPHSDAALYFGDKWVELQSFLTNRIDQRKKHLPKQKEVSATYPAWMEYFLELVRARGYSMLYPALQNEQRLVTIHHETPRLPEEFDVSSSTGKQKRDAQSEDKETHTAAEDNIEDEAFITPVLSAGDLSHSDADDDLASLRPLHEVLPFNAELSRLHNLPYLSNTGKSTSPANAAVAASAYAAKFRIEIGGCETDALSQKMEKAGRIRKRTRWSADDLFCWGDQVESDYEIAKSEWRGNARVVTGLGAEDGFKIDD